MKRIIGVLCCCIAGFLVVTHWAEAQTAAAPRQPVYIVLTTTVSDYVNWDISEERLRRTLAVLEKYRKNYPTLNETIYFSGAMSDALAQHDEKDKLLELVRRRIGQGLVLPGYDGLDEPTYAHRPMVDFSNAKTAADHWVARMNSAKELLTEARDPLTGVPQPGKSGGLKRMQEVFGPAFSIRGVVLEFPNMYGPAVETGSDAEIVNNLRQLNETAMFPGLAETNLGHTPGEEYRPWANAFSKAMSPEANTPPELYWQEDALRLSETSLLDWPARHAEDGVEALKTALARVDRSRIRVLRIELGGQRIYLKPVAPPDIKLVFPLAWAWDHPDNPLFPASRRYSGDGLEARWAAQDDVLKYLISDFLPANPGSRFVSVANLKAMAGPGWGYDLPFTTLHEAVVQMLADWGDKAAPPAYVKAGNQYLSLADLFEVLTDALAQRSRSGSFPASVHVGRVFGPLVTSRPNPPVTGEVTADSVARECTKLIDALHDDSWSQIPHNAIPSPVEIENLKLTPAQYLRLMADALVAPTPGTKLTIRNIDMFPAGQIVTFGVRRLKAELGAAWTYKPAVVLPARQPARPF